MKTLKPIHFRNATKVLLAIAALTAMSAQAVVHDFFPVTITGGNTAKLTSPNGNGYINAVTVGTNAVPLNNTAIQSQFTNLFAPSGVVPGWLTRYTNFVHYTNTFYLTNYASTSNLVFGMWNITEETNTYQLQLFTGNTMIAPPFTPANWNFLGYDDNVFPPDVNIAWKHMNLDYNTGFFSPTNYKSGGTDCDAAFWNKIPTNATHIVLIGRLSTNNWDGVGFYFAEPGTNCAITCPPDITVTICGPGTNVFFPAPAVSGLCGSNTNVTCDPVSGSYFALGTNTVYCSQPGTTNTCSFKVIVLNSDPIPPVINCPSNIVIFTCGTSAVTNYTVTATDNSGTVVSTNCSPASGSTFPLGTNAVLCTAVDACSNAATCAFYVIVKQLPSTWGVICPNESSFINVTGCPPVMPVLTNLVTLTNQCSTPTGLSITQAPPAGTVLSAGTHNAVIWVCPTNGSCSNCTVIVNAYISPGCCTIACPTNFTVSTCGSNNAVATFPTPPVSGPCASNVTVVCTPPSGSSFPHGTNTVTCIATNGAGVTVATCTFTITVVSSAFTSAYDFLSVSLTGPGGKFTSPNGKGFVTVTNTGGPFLPLNNTAFASQFPNLFSASGTVQGWLARADNNAAYTNTFDLANYALTPNTVFGIWNMTEEPNTYSIKTFAGNTQNAPPFVWSLMGYDDDALAGNIGWVHITLNAGSGDLSMIPFTSANTDSDAAFWTNIPTATTRIVVTGSLGAANADGVVFYFAERRPCPAIPCPLCQVTLSASLAGPDIVLSWRQDASDFSLEETSELVGPLVPWSPVTNSPTISAGQYHVTLAAQHPRKFYRLKQTQGGPGQP